MNNRLLEKQFEPIIELISGFRTRIFIAKERQSYPILDDMRATWAICMYKFVYLTAE